MGTTSVTLSVLATIKQRERILLRRGRNRLLSLQLIFFASFTSWRLACNRWAELRQSKPIHPLLDLYWYQQNTKFHEKKQGVHFTYYALYVSHILHLFISSITSPNVLQTLFPTRPPTKLFTLKVSL